MGIEKKEYSLLYNLFRKNLLHRIKCAKRKSHFGVFQESARYQVESDEKNNLECVLVTIKTAKCM